LIISFPHAYGGGVKEEVSIILKHGQFDNNKKESEAILAKIYEICKKI
jgi:hypothetical protein